MKIRIALAVAGATALPTTVVAEEVQLPQVVVSATRSESLLPTPASITVIDREEIETSGADNLITLLEGRGGIQIKDLYGDGSRAIIGMRGLNGGNAAANTLILVDGRRLNNADLAAPDLSSVRLKDVERVEIVQGSAGTLFGDQAVGGVINIITRAPARATTAQVAASVGSFDLRRVAASGSSQGERVGLRLSGEYLESDNFRDHNDRRYGNALARLDYRLNQGQLFAEAQHVTERISLPGSLTRDQLNSDRQQVDPAYAQDFDDQSTDLVRLGLNHSLSEQWQLEGEASWRDSDGDGKLYGTPFTQSRRHLALSPRLVGGLTTAGGEGLITLGADLDRIDYRFDSAYTATDAEQQTNALYLQTVVPITAQLGLTVGGRTAEVKYDLGAAGAGVDERDRVTVWELGARYTLTPEWTLLARRDGNFRFAKLDELTFVSPGSSGLDTQTGVSYELGAEWAAGGHRAKLLAWRLDLDHEIDFDSTAPGPWGSGANVNLEKTRRSGAIAEAEVALNAKLRLNGALSYTDPKMSGGPFSGKEIPFVARVSSRLGADWQFTDHWRLHGEWLHTGERYQDSDYENQLAKLDAVDEFNLAAHWEQGAWRVTGRIDNLTDERYPSYAAWAGYSTVERLYPAPGRHGSITVSYTF